jgi:hypothetical protein
MRLKVYNPGGLNRKHLDDRFGNAIVQRRTHYAAADKLKIIDTIEKMMADKNLFQNKACKVLQVRDTQVLRWRANPASIEEAARQRRCLCMKAQWDVGMPSLRSWCLLWTSGVGRGYLSRAYASSARPPT